MKLLRHFNTICCLLMIGAEKICFYCRFDYIQIKTYRTAFGYLVPEITSRTLGMGIAVFRKHGDDSITSNVGHCDNL